MRKTRDPKPNVTGKKSTVCVVQGRVGRKRSQRRGYGPCDYIVR